MGNGRLPAALLCFPSSLVYSNLEITKCRHPFQSKNRKRRLLSNHRSTRVGLRASAQAECKSASATVCLNR